MARCCTRSGLPPALLALLAAGLPIRLLWVLIHPVTPVSDFNEYNRHAATLAEHAVYSDNPGYSDAYWEPGWPVLLAGIYLLFGVHPQLGAVVGATLDWGAIVIAAVAAVRLLPRRGAVWTVGAMSFYPGAIVYSSVLGTEHLGAALFTAVVVLLPLLARLGQRR